MMPQMDPNSMIGAAIIGLTTTAALNWYRTMNNAKKTEGDIYFRPKKNLAMKDMLIMKMLEENETSKIDGKACFVVTDPDLPDNPIIHSSTGFCELTQYKKSEVEGRNCRFLQGANTV